jgi:hypothetical protein
MGIQDMINKLIELPRNFNCTDNKSIYDLLKETGYFENHDQITLENIMVTLSHNPQYVNDWLVYSEDKRSFSGWYIKLEDNQKYVVGCLNESGNDVNTEYSNSLDACAVFIKHELDSIRTC